MLRKYKIIEKRNAMFTARLFDELTPIYPDTEVKSGMTGYTVAGANGTYAGVHIAVSGLVPGIPVTFEIKGPHRAYKLFQLRPVPVEVNTGAVQRSEYLKNDYNEHVIRRAPFMVYEALEPIFNIVMPSLSAAAFAFRTPVEYCRQKDTKEWSIILRHGEEMQTLTLEVEQYPSIVPKAGSDTFPFLNWIDFDNIAWWHNAPKWSARYEMMLEQYFRLAVYTRQNTLTVPCAELFELDDNQVPILNEKHFSQIIRAAKKAGIKLFQGSALCTRAEWAVDDDKFYDSLDHEHFTTPEEINQEFKRQAFSCFDYGTEAVLELTGESVCSKKGRYQLRSALQQIQAFVVKNGLREVWIQSCLDEPNDALAEAYHVISRITREEMPGIPILEPVLPTEAVTGALDIWCPSLNIYEENRAFYDERVEKGERLCVYSCLTPGGNYCNRLLDMERLRVVWIAWGSIRYPNVGGYLHWGGNYTCSNDPFKRQASMYSERVMEYHPKYANFLPAGDECIFYPGFEMPMASTRSEAHRIGFEDLHLLQAIEKKAPGRGRKIVDKVFHGYQDYSKSVEEYRAARKEMLETAAELGI